MNIWYLMMWSVTVAPFEAGQYQTRERCEASAKMQIPILQHQYGKLTWQCELKTGG